LLDTEFIDVFVWCQYRPVMAILSYSCCWHSEVDECVILWLSTWN
jgi:hypothetical protein